MDNRTVALIARNRELLARAAEARVCAQEAIERAAAAVRVTMAIQQRGLWMRQPGEQSVVGMLRPPPAPTYHNVSYAAFPEISHSYRQIRGAVSAVPGPFNCAAASQGSRGDSN